MDIFYIFLYFSILILSLIFFSKLEHSKEATAIMGLSLAAIIIYAITGRPLGLIEPILIGFILDTSWKYTYTDIGANSSVKG